MIKKENNKSITKKEFVEILGGFTEDVLLPSVERIFNEKIDQKFAKHAYEMKNYIDGKLADQKGDIIAYIKGDRERDRSWKMKVIEILKKSKLAKPQDITMLINFVR